MKFVVRELSKAKSDKFEIFRWLHDRSPAGAARWLRSYDLLTARLQANPHSFSEALEAKDCEFAVKQALFKTPKGRVYRVIFFIEGNNVFILRVRGPGQAPIKPVDLR